MGVTQDAECLKASSKSSTNRQPEMAPRQHRICRSWMALPFLGLGLASCQTGSPSGALSINTSNPPRPSIVNLARTAQTCWFKSGDRAFRPYRLASEVNSHAGRPRFLLVPRNNPTGLPALVVQAENRRSEATGNYTNLQTFGPLLSSNSGKRITDDIRRWNSGNSSCT